MKSMCSVKWCLVSASLSLALVSGGCATTAPRAERYVAPPLGSTFKFSQITTGSYGSGTLHTTSKVTERMWEGKRMIAFVSPTGAILENPDGSWVAILGPEDEPVFSWDPPMAFDFPLEVGKTWTKSYRLTVYAAKQTIPFDSTGKVEAYEDVTVPAGTFKVYKVSSADTLGNESVSWFSPEFGLFIKRSDKRTEKNRSGLGTRVIELMSYSIAK
jgi:hypothetical protein